MHPIEEVIEDIRQGKMIILVDDEDRENEGDLVLAARMVTPEKINFMASKARGLICLSMSEERVKRLELPMMIPEDMNQTPNRTAFTVSIEAAEGVSTGISAKDRAHTIQVAAAETAKRSDLHFPGHIFPLKAKSGGVLERAGHTEGSLDLVKLAGLGDAAVICEIMCEDGSMARMNDLVDFATNFDLKIASIADLIRFRKEHAI
tara:strand:- start:6201 stop:6815 length:615 start_codon:yes stop_codon:yes gene_type:complete